MEIMNLAVRVPQFVFVLIVLSLSGALVHGQFYGNSSMNDYLVFCGAWGMLVTLVGIASGFVEALQGMVMLALDGLSTLFFFAGSIALAAKIGVHSCSFVDGVPTPYLFLNDVIGGGTFEVAQKNHGDDYVIGYPYSRRCREAQADCAFMFFAMAAFAASTVLDMFSLRKK